MSKKNILVVVESLDENHSSGIKGRIALINNLVECGYNVLVYHYSGKQISLPNINCYLINERKLNGFYLLSRLQRVFTRLTKININPFIEKLVGFSFTFFNDANSIKKALLKETNFNPDLVLTLSYASSFRPHKAVLGIPKWHSKWLAYVHDPFPMHSYPRPYDWVEPGHQFKRNFFLEIVDKSKHVVYPSKLLAEWMQSYYPKQEGKEIIIPHQLADLNQNSAELPSFFEKSKFTILHAGNMMSARNPIALINAFELFLNQNKEAKENAQLLFIGKASMYNDFIKEKQKTLPQLIMSDGYLPFSTVLEMQQLSSVNVILEAKGSMSPFLPGKFPHCIQAEKPILLLSPYYSESRRLLGYDYPNWSEIDNVELVTSHLTNLYEQWLLNDKKTNYKRKDLIEYLGATYLSKTILNISID